LGIVLIITDQYDSHADAVIIELYKRNIPVLRFHPDEYPEHYSISIEVKDGNIQGEIADAYRSVEFKDICTVWYRGTRALLPANKVIAATGLQDYIDEQVRATIRTMAEVINEELWISDPRRLRRAEVKAIQLAEASKVGLKTPHTLISNKQERVAVFLESLGEAECAVKPLSLQGVQGPDGYRFPLTTVLPREHYLNSVTSAPTIFQPYIPKIADLRCVVMGEHLFCAKILSQSQEESMRDWRGADCPHEPFVLPDAVQQSLHQLIKNFGLNLASADLILTPDEEIVFLELNPVGQWLWLEYQVGFPLVTTFVDLLMQPKLPVQ
jgi:glutathione synthase/RimK-type ligase-like ATP-grasp enzyme